MQVVPSEPWISRFVERQRLRRVLLLLVVLFALCLAYLVRYRGFVTGLRGFDVAAGDSFAEQVFPLLDESQITQLGIAHREDRRPASSYTLVDRTKPAEITRIGIFGCSFVNGAEADRGQDFPSQLQRLFDADEERSVEVLNFGVGAFGVQQSYLLWQYLSGEFDLDHTIYSLCGFHRKRDTTFVMLNTIFAPVHARYVLEGGDLRLVRVDGADRRKAAKGYFSLIPRWNYLRYDAKTPPQIRALLPPGRELRSNPFYYRRDVEEETGEIYGLVFADMADRSKRFLVLVNDTRSENLVKSSYEARAFSSVRTSTEKFTWDRSGLYQAQKNHPSALGYHILAHETHAILTGVQHVRLPDVEILGPIESAESHEMKRGLSGYDRVYLSFDGIPAAEFIRPVSNRTAEPYSFESNQTDSVLDVSGPRSPLFIALKGELPGEDLRLKFSVDGSPEELVLGGVSLIGGRHIGVLEPFRNTTRGDGWVLRPRAESSAISVDLISGKDITDIRLEIGGVVVLRGDDHRIEEAKLHRISWRSEQGDLVATRGHPLQNADAIVSTASGNYCITTREGDGVEEFWCTRRWRVESTPVKISTVGTPPID